MLRTPPSSRYIDDMRRLLLESITADRRRMGLMRFPGGAGGGGGDGAPGSPFGGGFLGDTPPQSPRGSVASSPINSMGSLSSPGSGSTAMSSGGLSGGGGHRLRTFSTRKIRPWAMPPQPESGNNPLREGAPAAVGTADRASSTGSSDVRGPSPPLGAGGRHSFAGRDGLSNVRQRLAGLFLRQNPTLGRLVSLAADTVVNNAATICVDHFLSSAVATAGRGLCLPAEFLQAHASGVPASCKKEVALFLPFIALPSATEVRAAAAAVCAPVCEKATQWARGYCAEHVSSAVDLLLPRAQPLSNDAKGRARFGGRIAASVPRLGPDMSALGDPARRVRRPRSPGEEEVLERTRRGNQYAKALAEQLVASSVAGVVADRMHVSVRERLDTALALASALSERRAKQLAQMKTNAAAAAAAMEANRGRAVTDAALAAAGDDADQVVADLLRGASDLRIAWRGYAASTASCRANSAAVPASSRSRSFESSGTVVPPGMDGDRHRKLERRLSLGLASGGYGGHGGDLRSPILDAVPVLDSVLEKCRGLLSGKDTDGGDQGEGGGGKCGEKGGGMGQAAALRCAAPYRARQLALLHLGPVLEGALHHLLVHHHNSKLASSPQSSPSYDSERADEREEQHRDRGCVLEVLRVVELALGTISQIARGMVEPGAAVAPSGGLQPRTLVLRLLTPAFASAVQEGRRRREASMRQAEANAAERTARDSSGRAESARGGESKGRGEGGSVAPPRVPRTLHFSASPQRPVPSRGAKDDDTDGRSTSFLARTIVNLLRNKTLAVVDVEEHSAGLLPILCRLACAAGKDVEASVGSTGRGGVAGEEEQAVDTLLGESKGSDEVASSACSAASDRPLLGDLATAQHALRWVSCTLVDAIDLYHREQCVVEGAGAGTLASYDSLQFAALSAYIDHECGQVRE